MPTDRQRRRTPLLATIAALVMVSATAGAARADDDEVPDARLAGYKEKVELGGGSAGSFALMALLGAISIGLMFKNANRSHLD